MNTEEFKSVAKTKGKKSPTLKNCVFAFIIGGTICVLYILNDFQINFIGTIDFGVWIVCIIVFNIIIEYVLNKAKHVQQ